jgi:electron transfer flavoprotein beta subunit
MDIIVCIKRVPETAESDIKINPSGKDIIHEGLVFTINEADNYALEEALLIKEKMGGTVTLITMGQKESDDTIRMGLAKGADTAIRLDDPAFAESDGIATAKILAAAIHKLKFDLILTGCIASDNGFSQIGPALAENLSIPHAAMVTEMKMAEKKVKASRELEGGLLEVLEIDLPAVLTIQTGINEPRYASIMGIAKASKKEIALQAIGDLGLNENEVGQKGSKTAIQSLTLPVQDKMAEIIPGTPEEATEKLSGILKERGLV